MSLLRRLLAEIHRRSLWQTLGVYLAGAWVVLQVVDILVDSLDLPRGLPALAILLILIGLPIALATAFFQSDERAPGGESEGRDGSQLATDSGRSGASPSVEVAPDRSDAGRRSEEGRHGVIHQGADRHTSDHQVSDHHTAEWIFTWRHVVAGGVLALALWGVIASGWLLFSDRGKVGAEAGRPGPDRGVVAVFPFHVTGPSDLAFLGEGMVDLLAAKLTGEGGLRAADPRSVMSAWRRAVPRDGGGIEREEALDLGRSLGADRVLLGGIVGTPSRLILNASVLGTGGGELQAQAMTEGPADSLTAMVDRLAVQLLALEAGEQGQRLASLTSTSLQALRSYLDGKVAYRSGRYSEASRHFERALQQDSTFALAALNWVSSAWWSPGFDDFNRALDYAWALREDLSPRDRAFLEAWAGPRYPEASGWAERLRMWELAATLAFDRPEAWYESGDIYFHYGALLEVPDWRDRAEARFRLALRLDSGFAAPVAHLLELAAMNGDLASLSSLGAAYAAVDSTGETAEYVRWRMASALGDSLALAEVRERMPDWEAPSLSRLMGLAQLYGSGLEEAELAASILVDRAGPKAERWEWLLGLHALALNRGRPGEALGRIEDWAEVEGTPGESQRIQVLDGLYWDGDTKAAARAAEILEDRVAAPLAAGDSLREALHSDRCVLEQWRLKQGETDAARSTLKQLLAMAPEGDRGSLPLRQAVCGAMIGTLLAMTEGDQDAAREYVPRLETLLLLAPEVETGDDPSLVAPFVLSAWRESRGDLPGALAAMRRWHNHWFTGVRYLSTYLREEGRLAALSGDTTGAMQAYRHYLALVSDPEPSRVPERDRVRMELERLEGQRGSGNSS